MAFAPVVSKVPVPPAETTSTGSPVAAIASATASSWRHRVARELRPSRVVGLERAVTLEAHDTAQLEAGQLGDPTRERDALRDGANAAPSEAHVHIDHHTDRRAGRRCRRDRSSAFAASSTATVTRAEPAISREQAIRSAPTTSFAIRRSATPPAASALASQTVAVVTPIAPRSTWSAATWGDLCVFACGAAWSARWTSACIRSRLRSSASRRSSRAGVARLVDRPSDRLLEPVAPWPAREPAVEDGSVRSRGRGVV